MGAGSGWYYTNYSKDDLITKLLIPFFNKWTIEGKYGKDKAIVNLGSAQFFRFFKTEHEINNEETINFQREQVIGFECTSEFLKEVRYDIASQSAKSLLEKVMIPPKKQMFCIMKFEDEELDSAYDMVVAPLGDKYGYSVLRIDSKENSEVVTDEILDSIAKSELIYAELSYERPNCYFEIGIALSLGKELILVIKKDQKIHFDLQGYRFIEWKTEKELYKKLKNRLDAIKKRKIEVDKT